MSATTNADIVLRPATPWRRAALMICLIAFAVLWVGGVASEWLGRAREDQGWLASLFLALAGLIVLLGARTRRETLTLAGVAALGFAVELLGVRTGFPFGEYAYTAVLRPQLLGVPVVMGCAWVALVAFACELSGRLRLSAWPAAFVAALWTTATDLVIDPLAVNHFHYWTWAREGNYYGVPFVNFVGWFATALVACRLVGPRPLTNHWAVFVGLAILLFFSSIALAHALPAVALVGLGLSAAALIFAKKF